MEAWETRVRGISLFLDPEAEMGLVGWRSGRRPVCMAQSECGWQCKDARSERKEGAGHRGV